jgi:GxxExxY protein
VNQSGANLNLTEELNSLTYRIVGVCMEVHRELGPGFPEEYYQKALELEFGQQGIAFEPQKPVQVNYKGTQVGLNFIDFVVDGKVILEIKSVRQLDDVHRGQVIKYFAATGLGLGLLVNFGQSSLKHERLFPPKKIEEHQKNSQRI